MTTHPYKYYWYHLEFIEEYANVSFLKKDNNKKIPESK